MDFSTLTPEQIAAYWRDASRSLHQSLVRNASFLTAARSARDSIKKRSTALLDSAERSGRNLTADERREFDAGMDDLAALKECFEQERNLPLPRSASGPDSRTVEADDSVLLRSDQRLADRVRERTGDDGERLSLGRFMRGLAIGDWSNAQAELRALGEGAVGTGGAMVPTILAAELIDKARAKTAVIAAGARTFEMQSDQVKIAKLTGDPTADWLAENAVQTDTDLTFTTVDLNAETARVLVRASREVVEDAEGLEALISSTFAAVLARKLDLAALRGTGTTPEPGPGIRNATGVNIVDAGTNGAALSWDMVIDALTEVAKDNHDIPDALVWHPRTAGAAAKLKDADLNPLTLPEMVADLRKLTTTAIPTNLTAGTGTNLTEVYVGNFEEMVVAIRTNIGVEILRERYADQYQFGFLGFVRADVAVLRGEAFAVITNVSS